MDNKVSLKLDLLLVLIAFNIVLTFALMHQHDKLNRKIEVNSTHITNKIDTLFYD